MIFENGNSKGNCLKTFIQQFGYQPANILMVDDKINNLQDVNNVISNMGINFEGIRYGYLDEKMAKFDMSVATEELNQFINQHQLNAEAQNALVKLKMSRGENLNTFPHPK